MDEEDLPFSDGASSDSISVFRKEFNKFDKYATNYSIVSYGMRDGLINALKFDSEHAKKIHVIHNGFSQEDKPPMICSHIPNKLDIAYVGDLYAGKRDATMLFKAIRGLIDNGLAQSSDFLIDYAGDSCDSLYENAKPYELQDIIYSHGRIARKDAITMQASADILLLLTWNTKMDRGILTGKLYEYMLIEKPIICITSGEIPQGEATETINELALGFAGEYVSLTEDSLRLEKYLEIQLKRKLNNQKLLFEPNLKGVNEFDYDNLVIKLQKIMGIIN